MKNIGMLLAAAFLVLSAGHTVASGQQSITGSGTITESFSGFAGTASPTNWSVQGSGTRGTTWNGTNQTAGTNGGWYGNANMSFLGSGTALNGNGTWLLQNNTGGAITGFTISFTARLWKVGSASPSVAVSWVSDASSSDPAQGALPNSLSSLSFSDATTNISTGTTLSETVTGLSIANGDFIHVRWIHSGGANSDNLGWDDVQFTPTLAPTAVELVSISATAFTNGTFLEWQTGYEVDNLGFHIYREQGRMLTRITPSIVAGSALLAGARLPLTAGYSYTWWDSGSSSGEEALYWLEDLDLNGKVTRYGPITPKPVGGRPPKRSQAALLSRLGAREARPAQVTWTNHNESLASDWQARQSMAAANSPRDVQFEIAASAAVKISVREEGWYRITQPELVGAGLDAQVDPRNLRMFLEGQEQAIIVTGQSDGRFDTSDALEFYGVGLNTPFSSTHTYWLVGGTRRGKRIGSVQTRGLAGGARSFPFTLELKERTVYFAALKNGEAENFFGRTVGSEPVDHIFTLTNLDSTPPGAAEIEIGLQGVTDLPASTSDHQVRVIVNGAQVGRLVFDGSTHHVERLSVSQSLLHQGDNAVTLVAEGGETDVSLVDYIRMTYWHTYTADQNSLRLTAGSSSTRTQTIRGFSSAAVRVIDVTAPDDAQEFIGRVELDATNYAVTVDVPGPRALLSFTPDRIKHPAGITRNEPSTLNQKKQVADLVMIAHAGFVGSLSALKALRESQRLSVKVIDIEDVYDEFSFGQKSPHALRDFLSLANASWKRPPSFVLLVGDASFDPKNYLGLGDHDFVPTKLVDTALLETASDDWFVDFNEDGLPDVAIGRLPVRSLQDATTIVSKIVTYEQSAATQSLLLVADRNDGFDFEAATDRLRSLVPPGLTVEEVRRGQIDDQTARVRLLDAINRGQKLVNYTGHGSVEIWRGNLLTSADAHRLTNEKLPFFVAMNCLNGLFHDLYTESLAEALMRAERGGAVAVWASSALTEPDQQAAMNQQLYRLLFDSRSVLTLGEAAMNAKAAISSSDVRRTWIFFGDPSTRFK
jgi:hypothetical protein